MGMRDEQHPELSANGIFSERDDNFIQNIFNGFSIFKNTI
jgi:hypothetical protein